MPSCSRTFPAFSMAASGETPGSWARIASTKWSPIFFTGLSDVIGSWKIMATTFPLASLSCSLSSVSMSFPSSSIFPWVTLPWGGIRFSNARPRVDLPHPDSPTMPRVSSSSRSKLTPWTAFSSPFSVL